MASTSDELYPKIAELLGLPKEKIKACEIVMRATSDIRVFLTQYIDNPPTSSLWYVGDVIGTLDGYECLVMDSAIRHDDAFTQTVQCIIRPVSS